MHHDATSTPAIVPRDAEHRRLGEELPDDPCPSGAERGTDAHFALSRGAMRDQQVRHVGTREQEQQADGAEEDPHRVPESRRDQPLVEEHRPGAPPAVGRRTRLRKTAAELAQLTSQPGQRSASGKPADDGEVLVVAVLLTIGAERNPRAGAARKVESARHHADDVEGLTIEPDDAVED